MSNIKAESRQRSKENTEEDQQHDITDTNAAPLIRRREIILVVSRVMTEPIFRHRSRTPHGHNGDKKAYSNKYGNQQREHAHIVKQKAAPPQERERRRKGSARAMSWRRHRGAPRESIWGYSLSRRQGEEGKLGRDIIGISTHNAAMRGAEIWLKP